MTSLEDALRTYFGLNEFRHPQREIIQNIVDKKDTIALLPTGKGKSLCFQLPSVLLPPTTIVISPLLALMHDQVLKLQARGLSAHALTSDLSPAERSTLLQQLQASTLQFLYLSPEQLQNHRTKNALLSANISHLCVDEAHCISQWGHDFRPEYLQIPQFLNEYTQNYPRPVLSAFTATASTRVWNDIHTYFPLQTPQEFLLPYFRPNLDYCVALIESEAQKRRYCQELLQFWIENSLGKFLIYVPTRLDAEFYSHWLRVLGFPAQAFHAGLSATKRNQLLSTFQTAPTGVLIATTAFGMGIDIPDIRIVVHLSPPTNLSAYAQESGRAGRDGKRSWCILFFRPEELEKNYELFPSSTPTLQLHQKKEAYTMHRWALSAPCYAQNLAQYFNVQKTWRPEEIKCQCSRCAPGLPWKIELRKKEILTDHFRKP